MFVNLSSGSSVNRSEPRGKREPFTYHVVKYSFLTLCLFSNVTVVCLISTRVDTSTWSPRCMIWSSPESDVEPPGLWLQRRLVRPSFKLVLVSLGGSFASTEMLCQSKCVEPKLRNKMFRLDLADVSSGRGSMEHTLVQYLE